MCSGLERYLVGLRGAGDRRADEDRSVDQEARSLSKSLAGRPCGRHHPMECDGGDYGEYDHRPLSRSVDARRFGLRGSSGDARQYGVVGSIPRLRSGLVVGDGHGRAAASARTAHALKMPAQPRQPVFRTVSRGLRDSAAPLFGYHSRSG